MKKILMTFLILGIGLLGIGGYIAWDHLYRTVIDEDGYVYIESNSDFESLITQLKEQNCIRNEEAFRRVANLLNYNKNILAGKYEVEKGWHRMKFIKKLRSGTGETVELSFHNVRTKEQLAGKVAPFIEADSVELVELFYNTQQLEEMGVSEDLFCYILPNTYEFYWNTSAHAFMQRMLKERDRFWTEERKKKAIDLGLLPCEVVTLASIVQEEQNKFVEEQDRIAGLYLNRLKRGMLLQADPTLKYALGDWGLKRVLNIHKEVESPYNTYKYTGLPPGPISLPEPHALDAVLNYERHDFLYMCAKEDFSGYHNFARSLLQHNINARKYQRALSQEMRKARAEQD